jgi:hypothetical protein
MKCMKPQVMLRRFAFDFITEWGWLALWRQVAAVVLLLLALLHDLFTPYWPSWPITLAALILLLWRDRLPTRPTDLPLPVAVPSPANPPVVDANDTIQTIGMYKGHKVYSWRNLRFSSKSEIAIARALEKVDAFFIPNAHARLSGAYVNRELDFVVCYQGGWGVLEVDGIHHRESLSATEYDAERDHILHKHGVRTIMRVTAARCHEEPQSVVREFLALLAAPAANAAPTPPLPNVRASSVDKPAS